jgi:outer membrane protein insertion porin family
MSPLPLLLSISLAATSELGGPSRVAGDSATTPDSSRVLSVSVTGARAFPEVRLRELMRVRAGSTFRREDWAADLEALRGLYRDAGFLFIELAGSQTPTLKGLALAIQIKEGSRMRPGEIRFEGNRMFSGLYLRNHLRRRPGTYFSEDELRGDIERLLALYERNGYPFARISPGEFLARGDSLDLTLRVEEGPRVRIAHIRPQGLRATRPYVVAREFRLRAGDYYDQRMIDAGLKRLKSSGLFAAVEEPVLRLTEEEGWCDLEIPLREAPGNRIGGFFGYTPDSPGGSPRLTGELLLEAGNLAGTGRKARLVWGRRQESSSELSVTYEDPWLFSRPASLLVRLEHRIQDSLYARTDGDVSLAGEVSERWLIALGVGAERAVPQGASDSAGQRSRKAKLIFRARYRSLDLPQNPRQGSHVDLQVETGILEVLPDRGSPRRASVSKFTLDALCARALGERQVIALGGKGQAAFSTLLPLPRSELFALGGWRSLRGYREEEFWGSRVISSSLEYRFLLPPEGRLFTFVDAGRVDAGSAELGTGNDFLISYGAGLRIAARVGSVGLDYGVPAGSSPTEGRVHVGLESVF